jgi:peroxiredoxin family protein
MSTDRSNQSIPSGVTMVIFSGELDKMLAAFIIATGAASMDMEVNMFFTFWGVNALRKDAPETLVKKKTLIEAMFGWMMPKGPGKLKLSKMEMGGLGRMLLKKEMKKKSVTSLEELIEAAKELNVNITVCTMSMDIMGIREEELIDGIEYGGVASFLDSADRCKTTLFI